MWCYKFIYFAEYFFPIKCVLTFAWERTKRCKHFRDISLCSSVRSNLVSFGGLFGILRFEIWFLGPNQWFGRFKVQFVLICFCFQEQTGGSIGLRFGVRFLEVQKVSSFGILRFNPILLQSHTYLQLQNPHPLLLKYYNMKVFV